MANPAILYYDEREMKHNAKKTSLSIAFVADAVLPFHQGGKEQRIFELGKRLLDRGHQVHIYTQHWWDEPAKTVEIEGIVYHALIKKQAQFYQNNHRSVKSSLIFGLGCLKLIRTRHDVVDIDHMPYWPVIFGVPAAFLTGAKVFVTWHEVWGFRYWSDYFGRIGGFIGACLEVIAAKMAPRLIPVSQHTAARLRTTLFARRPQFLVTNGIDTLHNQTIKPARKKYDIIYSGRQVKHKRLDLLLDALPIVIKQFPKLKVAIIGEGPIHNDLVARAKRKKLTKHVAFLPFFPEIDAMRKQVKASKLFVSPSQREGFGIAVMEAYTLGIPCVINDAPHNAAMDFAYLPGVTAFYESSEDLAVKIIAALKHPVAPQTLYEKSKKLDWDTATTTLEQAYYKA